MSESLQGAGGEQLDTGCCIVFETRHGRIIDGRERFFDLYHWDELNELVPIEN